MTVRKVLSIAEKGVACTCTDGHVCTASAVPITEGGPMCSCCFADCPEVHPQKEEGLVDSTGGDGAR